MATRTVEVVAHTAAAPQVVWDLVADVESWAEWSLYDEARLESTGEGHPNGLGARRFLRADRVRSVDEVFAFEPPRRLAYVVVESRLPARDLRSEIQLSPTVQGGTEIWWRSSYEPKFLGTGWMMDRNLKILLADTIRRLAVRADTGAPLADD